MRNQSVTYSAPRVFEALSDPTRRAISRHLRRLRHAHLVSEHREGRNRIYQLNPEPLRTVDTWLDRYRGFWKMNLASLKTFVEAEYAKEIGQNDAVKARKKRRRH